MMFSSPIKLPSGCGSLLSRLLRFKRMQGSGFGFGLASGPLAPIKGALLYNVDVTRQQQPHENHHFQINKPAHRVAQVCECFEHCRPGHKKDHLYIEEDEEHPDEVELH